MLVDKRLKDAGIVLPGAPKALGLYVPAVRTGDLVYVSGMLPFRDGSLMRIGRLGEAGVGAEEGYEMCKVAAINALAALKGLIGDLDKVTRCVRLCGYIASTPDFYDQPKALNGASEVMALAFGELGAHSRVAVGVASLPMNSPVEIEFIFEVKG